MAASNAEPERRPRRRYDATGRRERAARTRATIYRAAFELFSERGYAGTTIADIAAAAGVSSETIHKMGPKSSLLDGAREVAVFDDSDIASVGDTDVMGRVAAQGSFPAAVEVLVDFYAVSNRRAARFWVSWRAAASEEPAVAEAWQVEMASARRAFEASIAFGRSRGWLRDDVEDQELAATLWLLASAETYVRLTADAGLDEDGYRAWLRRSLLEQLGS
ncbi:TetR family transcriptional regulator [Nocardioides lijunqiniae]|uniref:TetR family transcriptional regulator n=1 Tax=Nocardioides lijunqiniae TaxID=2760832 RepID=UPI00187812E1|nr:TetR family transcriptional regulator [Nocardioides lijunqiniae]